MNSDELMLASKGIVSRNVNDHILAATISWNAESYSLSLTYYLDRDPTDNDEEQCELALAELIAEFNDIFSAASSCVRLQENLKIDQLESLVYRRQ